MVFNSFFAKIVKGNKLRELELMDFPKKGATFEKTTDRYSFIMDRFLSFLFCVLAVAACKTHQTAESITPADEAFMREAIRLSVESVARGGGPFGAVIVKDGEILASRSNSVTLDNDPTAHAEINAIRTACRALGTFDLAG